MVLGLVKYYQDIWENRSKVLVPLIELVGLFSHNEVTKKKGAKKNSPLGIITLATFEKMKQFIVCNIVLAYPSFELPMYETINKEPLLFKLKANCLLQLKANGVKQLYTIIKK